ncbi:MAG: BspA family leucine-rich repeat surface protein [Clostridia bacterium]|nr:BspA family leucine-rich repeat surface protein [Clostridia bacterium]
MANSVNTSSATVRTCDIFISYRRDGGDMTAMYFYQALKERGYKVFYDLEVLRAGKFNEALLDSIQSCKDFVLILSPHALDRCSDESDWVRREIAEALRAKKNIVPVMLKGFAFPEKLPEDIDDIRYQNGLTCTTEYFEESINRLCDRYLNSLPASATKKRSPLIPVLAVIAALAVAFGGYMAFRGGKSPAPTPEPTATVEITEAPTATPVPTATPQPTEAPTEAPTATPVPTDTPEPITEPGLKVVKDTDFPALYRGMDTVAGIPEFDDDAYRELLGNAPAFNLPNVRRRDVASVTFLPTLEGAPEDAVDVSDAADGRVLAWATPYGELYDLTIAGDGGVKVLECDGLSPMFSYFFNLERVDFNGCVDMSERTDFSRLFWCCHNLKEVNFDGVCTGNAVTFSGLFGGCWVLESVDVTGFDTSRAESFDGMFLDCSQLASLDVTGFDTGHCRNMESMFIGCESLKSLDLSGFDTSRVQQMEYMFEGCKSLEALDLSAFDTARVTNMERMFGNCENLNALDLSGFDTGRVTNMKEMFMRCINLVDLNISAFNTGRVQNMFGMFNDCENLATLDIGGFDTSRVEDMACVFFGCKQLDGLDLSGWDTGRAETMSHMFAVCESLYKLDLSNWNTSGVTNMSVMFSMCRSMVELNLSGWDVSHVTDMSRMFEDCGRLESIGRDPESFARGNTQGMYEGCDNLK